MRAACVADARYEGRWGDTVLPTSDRGGGPGISSSPWTSRESSKHLSGVKLMVRNATTYNHRRRVRTESESIEQDIDADEIRTRVFKICTCPLYESLIPLTTTTTHLLY